MSSQKIISAFFELDEPIFGLEEQFEIAELIAQVLIENGLEESDGLRVAS